MKNYRRPVPLIFYLLAGLNGTAFSIGFLTWFREYTRFFGSHTVSVATIVIVILTSMAIGSFYSGKLSDRINYRLELFAILSCIAAAFLLCDPYLFNGMTEMFFRLNGTLNMGTFRFEMLRLLLTFFSLVIPAGIMAGMFILILRHFIRHTRETGIFMSAAIAAGATGALAGILISSFLLIPLYGCRMSQVLGAALCLINALITLSYRMRTHLKSPADRLSHTALMIRKAAMRFRKKKTVLETSAKLTRAMIRVYTFQGFMAAAYLLISIRILAYHSSIKPIYFHTLVMSVVLAGLTLGSALYRRTVDKPVNSFLTLATLQIIAGISAVLSYAALYVMHNTIRHEAAVSGTFPELLANHLLLYATLIFLPAAITGLSLPLTGKVYPRRLDKTGARFGRLGFICFISAVFGITFTLYIFIPFAGLYYTFFALILLIVLSGVYLILRDSRLIRGFRFGYAVLSVLLYVILVGVFKPFHFNILRSDLEKAQPVVMIEGSTTSLSTVDLEGGGKSALLNNQLLFSSDQNGLKEQQIPAFLPALLNNNIQSALVIGFGMGTTAFVLEENGVKDIHITEFFPEILRFSADIFAEDNDDILTSSRVTITIEDATSYLNRTERMVDLITTGYAQLDQIPGIYTTEFYRLCFRHLTDSGLMCQVLPADGITLHEFKALIKSFAVVFPDVMLWYLTPERLLLVGAKTHPETELCRLLTDFSDLNRKENLVLIGIPDLESLMAQLLLDDRQIRQYVENAPENTDNRPLAQYSRSISHKAGEEILRSLSNMAVDYNNFLQIKGNCAGETSGSLRKIIRLNEELKQRLVLYSGSPQ